MQLIRKAVLAVCVVGVCALAAITHTAINAEGFHEAWEAFGLGLIIICIVGRSWCSLYIGGRKKAEIVSRGPYSISRNPLYVFSFFGAFGVGAQSGSVTIAALFMLAAYAVFFFTVKREEAWLEAMFGAGYVAYCERTPRFLPDFALWRDEAVLSVRPSFFLTTLRDGMVFLLAIPLFEAVDLAQALGWLRVLARLP